MTDSVRSLANARADDGKLSSAEAWFEGGARIGYDSNARATEGA